MVHQPAGVVLEALRLQHGWRLDLARNLPFFAVAITADARYVAKET